MLITEKEAGVICTTTISRFHFCMSSFMALQKQYWNKRSTTIIRPVRLLFSVWPPVAVQSIGLCKWGSTNITFVSSLCWMCSFVMLYICFSNIYIKTVMVLRISGNDVKLFHRKEKCSMFFFPGKGDWVNYICINYHALIVMLRVMERLSS